MLIKALIVSAMGGLFCLDRVFMQAMLSRPIVCGTALGFLLQDPYTGLYIGAAIELLWLDRLPVGTYVPPNETIVAVATASVAITAGQELGKISHELIAFSILLLLPSGMLTQRLDAWIIRSNDNLAKGAQQDGREANLSGIAGKHLYAMGRYCVVCAGAILCLFFIGTALTGAIYPHLPAFVLKALAMCYYAFPLVGIAVAMNTINHRGLIPILSGSFLVLVVIWEFFHEF
jgi:PTS system mannose-specific IIC component